MATRSQGLAGTSQTVLLMFRFGGLLVAMSVLGSGCRMRGWTPKLVFVATVARRRCCGRRNHHVGSRLLADPWSFAVSVGIGVWSCPYGALTFRPRPIRINPDRP